MGTETQEITREDVLMLTLHQDMASWLSVEPIEYQKYINQLLPWQEGENIIASLRPVDLECQCLALAIKGEVDKKHKEFDIYGLTMISLIYTALQTGGYTYASRIKNAGAEAILFLAIKRRENQAWWVEVEPDSHTKWIEALKAFM